MTYVTACINTEEPAEMLFETSPSIEPVQNGLQSVEASTLTAVNVWEGAGVNAISMPDLNLVSKSTDRSIKFFGSQAYGNRFVFILDVSTSMNARANERIVRAREELIRSVSSLSPLQEFYVLLFSYQVIPMFGDEQPRYVHPDPNQLSKLKYWLDQVELRPGTDPRRALSIARSMRPDAVFLLTDGDFNRPPLMLSSSGWIDPAGKRNNRTVKEGLVRYFKELPVHCIAFENPFTFQSMKDIGAITGGSARYVKTQSLEAVDKVLFKSAMQSINARRERDQELPSHQLNRLTWAKRLISAGELVYADYVSRPLRQQELANDGNRALANQIFETATCSSSLRDEETGDQRSVGLRSKKKARPTTIIERCLDRFYQWVEVVVVVAFK